MLHGSKRRGSMLRFWTGAIAVAFALALVAQAQAGHPGGSSHMSSGSHLSFNQIHNDSHHDSHYDSHHDYFLKFGKRFDYGYFYAGRNFTHWSYCYWDYRYGCYLYWDPSLSCYYYWCAPVSYYYPVTYCPYKTYCWQAPVGGTLPAPVASVPTVTAKQDVNVAPTPVPGSKLPPDLPPPTGGVPTTMPPVR
jgi:hypothetical protein